MTVLVEPHYAVFYALVTEHDDAGVFVDYYYLGGLTENKEEAEQLSYDLTNDKSLPGTVVTKFYRISGVVNINKVMNMASKFFHQLANQMYDAEDMQKRHKNRG